ncbi:MAG: thioredoxin family protein [Bacteroidota bacterium]
MKQLFGLFLILALCMSFVIHPSPTRKGGSLEVGDIAPNFSLVNIDGSTFTLSEQRGQVEGFIITFTCNTCPYAQMYEDRLIALHHKYGNRYPVIAINPNDPLVNSGDSFAAMQQRAHQKGFPYPYLIDKAQEVYPQYGATRTPHVFLLDKDLVVRYTGAIDDNAQDAFGVQKNYLENALNALIDGQEPNPCFTKAVGCSIKTQLRLAKK